MLLCQFLSRVRVGRVLLFAGFSVLFPVVWLCTIVAGVWSDAGWIVLVSVDVVR